MKFGLYCPDARTAGAKSVAIGLLKHLGESPGGHEYLAIVPPNCGYESVRSPSIKTLELDGAGGLGSFRLLGNFEKQASSLGLDAIFMMGNLAMKRGIVPQALLMHNPWYAYPQSRAWSRLTPKEWLHRKGRNLIFHRSAMAADFLVVQTMAMRAQIMKRTGRPLSDFRQLPNGPTTVDWIGDIHPDARVVGFGHKCTALVLSRHYPHKNLEIIPLVVDELLNQNRTDIGFITTISADHGLGAERLLRKLTTVREKLWHNIGPVPMTVVPGLYSASACLFLPSLFESHSGTFEDAMAYNRPVVTADMPWARELLPESSFFCDPTSPASLASALVELAEGSPRITLLQREARVLLNSRQKWPDIASAARTILEETAFRRS
jgi:glycosyltransferase involved in cell wall biosynthesis